MIKNYFINLGKIFSDSAKFFVKNFKSHNLLILLLIILQIAIATPILYFVKQIGFMAFPLTYKILSIFGLGIYFVLFFFMYKKVFSLCAKGLEKEEISNCKMTKALLTLGLFNCIPFVAFLLCYGVAVLIPNSALIMKTLLNISTYIFYFAMCLSISSIVLWQDRNVFVAIAKSIKMFFKKILYTVPVFLVLFLIASLVTFAICSIIYAVAIKMQVININLINSVHAIVNLYSLYVFAGLYIGAQVKILEGKNE